jgi:hypothetical protein
LGRNVELDRPTKGVAGAARHSPTAWCKSS